MDVAASRRRLGRGVAAAVLSALLISGLTSLAGCAGGDAPVAGAPGGITVADVPSAEPEGRAATALARSVPTELVIPRIAVRSSLVELGLNADETVQVPPVNQPMQAGWYSLGPTPGELGPAVLLGHVDGHHKPGVFYRLKELRAGDEVQIQRGDGQTAIFTVTRIQQVPKAEFPSEAVYGDTRGPELRLITCGGSFDAARHSYRDNIIVYAELKDVRRPSSGEFRRSRQVV